MKETTSQQNSCSIVGITGIAIQIILGLLSFSILILKRKYQKNKRPWQIWFYDTLKQIISQLLAHIINILISMLLTKSKTQNNCLWYFSTNILANTIGVYICYLCLKQIQKYFKQNNMRELVSGNYYRIEKKYMSEACTMEEEQNQVVMFMRIWLMQLLIWNIIVIISKIMLFVMQLLLRDFFDKFSMFMLAWFEDKPTLELIFVVVVAPVVMNGLAFWVQDNFLKKNQCSDEEQAL